MASYAARGLRLRYEQAGGGRPVVLLHGMSNHCLAWAPQLDALAAAGWRPVLPDLAGHGWSDPVTERTTTEDLAGDVVALLDVLEVAAGVRVPVLAVAGRHDRLAPPQMVEQIAVSVPCGRLEVVEDAQHLVNLERPDRFNELLLGLLAQA